MTRTRFLSFLAGLTLLGLGLVCGLGGCGAPEAEPAPGSPGLPTSAAAEPEEPAPGEPSEILPPAPQVEVTPTVPALPTQAAPALLESRRLTLEFPHRIRVGDSDVLRLTLEMDDLGGLTPTVEVKGHTVTGETVQIPNLYSTHTVIAESRLDMAGMQIEPSDVQQETLLPGEGVTFYWSLSPSESGLYRGAVKLHLRFVPLGGGAESRKTITSQVVEIRAAKLLGLAGGPARFVGAVGTVLGAVLGFPFVDDILRWVWRRARSRARRSV